MSWKNSIKGFAVSLQEEAPMHKDGTCWLLLANTRGRRPWLHKEMQTMPRVCWHSTYPSWQSPQSDLPLALFHVGNEHIGTTTKGLMSSQILISRHRLLDQVDRSKTTARNYDQWGGEIHLEIPHLQVRPPIRHCHWQRHLIQSSDLWWLPGKARHQAPSHLCWTSSDQRLGRGSQQSHP